MKLFFTGHWKFVTSKCAWSYRSVNLPGLYDNVLKLQRAFIITALLCVTSVYCGHDFFKAACSLLQLGPHIYLWGNANLFCHQDTTHLPVLSLPLSQLCYWHVSVFLKKRQNNLKFIEWDFKITFTFSCYGIIRFPPGPWRPILN